MTVAELLRHARESYLRDAAAPFLWSAQELLRYLNEAQVLFARHTHILMDDASDFTTITSAPGVTRYALDPRIVFVSEVYDDTGRRLLAASRAKAPRTPFQGKPRHYTLDASVSTLRLLPTPDDVYEFNLVVARTPLKPLVTEYDTPEIPEAYHLSLLDWVAYKALRNNDTEGSNVTAAEIFRLDWTKTLLYAKRDAFTLRHSSNIHAVNDWTGS
jgi:hypothetical protein